VGALAVGSALLALSAVAVYYVAMPSKVEVTGSGTATPQEMVTVGNVSWHVNATVKPTCNATVYESPNLPFSSAAGTLLTVYATVEYPDGNVPACADSSVTIDQVLTSTPGFSVTGGNLPLTVTHSSSTGVSFGLLLVTIELPSVGADVPSLTLSASGN